MRKNLNPYEKMSRPSLSCAILISVDYYTAKTIIHNGWDQGQYYRKPRESFFGIYICLIFFLNSQIMMDFLLMRGKLVLRLVYLHSLNFQFHVILPGSFPVLPLLPAVAVPSIADFLAGVEKHRPGLWPKFKLYKTWQGKIQLLVTDTPYLNFLR